MELLFTELISVSLNLFFSPRPRTISPNMAIDQCIQILPNMNLISASGKVRKSAFFQPSITAIPNWMLGDLYNMRLEIRKLPDIYEPQRA